MVCFLKKDVEAIEIITLIGQGVSCLWWVVSCLWLVVCWKKEYHRIYISLVEQTVGWVEIRGTSVGFRSSTQPTNDHNITTSSFRKCG
jgi:hypothetical protein